MAVPRMRFGVYRAGVAEATAAILAGVAVEALAIDAAARNADAKAMARHRGEIADDDGEVARVAAETQIRERALLGIAGVDPAKAFGLGVELVQGLELAIEAIEIADDELHATV